MIMQIRFELNIYGHQHAEMPRLLPGESTGGAGESDDGLYLTPGSVDADHAAGSHSEPLTSNLAPVPTISADSRARRIRKTRTFDLHACICGTGVSEVEIQGGDSVMKCKVHGCETVWVRHFIEFSTSQHSFVCLVSSFVYEL